MGNTRPEILDAAKKIVCGEREQQYGGPEDNFGIIADMWSAYLRSKKNDEPVTAKDVAAMMVLLKVARISTGSKLDSWVDICGYGACGGEIEFGKKNPTQDKLCNLPLSELRGKVSADELADMLRNVGVPETVIPEFVSKEKEEQYSAPEEITGEWIKNLPNDQFDRAIALSNLYAARLKEELFRLISWREADKRRDTNASDEHWLGSMIANAVEAEKDRLMAAKFKDTLEAVKKEELRSEVGDIK